MSGAVHIAFEDLKKAQKKVDAKDSWIKELGLQLKSLQISKDFEVSGLEDKLEKERDQADKESWELRSEIALLKEQLSQKDEEAVISKFKQNEEYDQAIANAGAPEIERCWIIAERHIKTNPGANWATLVDEFLDAKDNIEKGPGEPEPYNGPTLAFLPRPPPRDLA